MTHIDWNDLYVFVILFLLFIYVLTFNRITLLHKAYLGFHMMMMIWPLSQFAISATTNVTLDWLYLNLSFIGLSFMGYGWLVFSLVLTQKIYTMNKTTVLLLSIPAVISSIMVTTNPLHHLFAQPINGDYFDRTYGLFFWVFFAFCIFYVATATILMMKAVLSSKGDNIKKQVYLFLIGLAILFLFAFLDIFINVILNVGIVAGLTSTGIILSDICFVIAVKRYNIFNIISIAQRDVIDHMDMGLIMIDKDEIVIDANKGASKFLNVQQGQQFMMEDFVGHVESSGNAAEFLKQYYSPAKLLRFQTEIILKSNENRHVSVYVSPIMETNNTFLGRIITLNDVTEVHSLLEAMNRKNGILREQNKELSTAKEKLFEVNKKLEQMAITDSLTGCYNRRYFFEQVEHQILVGQRYDHSFSMLLFDLDHFKKVNDQYGHPIGDEVIIKIIEKVRPILRRTDLIGRYGGEEFMIFMPQTNSDEAKALAERVRGEIDRSKIETSDGKVQITLSIGVISIENSPAFENSKLYLEELITNADKALYKAKANGRNCIVAV